MFQLFFKKPRNLRDDVLSGLTVALALVPEAVAFAFVAGVDPLVGLYAAFFVGLITSIFGGRPGMISGATGAMAVVMTPFVATYGLAALCAAVITTGIFQIIAGLVGVGKFIRLLPHPVMLGFVNGLAIVIGLAQLAQFKTNHHLEYTDGNFQIVAEWMNLGDPIFTNMIVMVVITMLIVQFLPKLFRAIPAPLVAILLCTGLSQFSQLQSPTVVEVVQKQRVLAFAKVQAEQTLAARKDSLVLAELPQVAAEIASLPVSVEDRANLPRGLKAGLPRFQIPKIAWEWEFLSALLLLALTLASIGLIESLMTLSLIDEITETNGSPNRECLAQGLANIVTGLFGGMGGCAMIGQSMININSGGRGRTSGISAALFLFGFILLAPALIEIMPIASLVGVMFMVVIATFEWSSFRLIGKIPRSDLLVIFAVSGLTVIFDLALAVGVGIILAALNYAWGCSQRLTVKTVLDPDTGSKTYQLFGELFFGSSSSFKDHFSPRTDPTNVFLDLSKAKVCDHSGLEAINGLSQKYRGLGKNLQLLNLNSECSLLLSRADALIDVSIG